VTEGHQHARKTAITKYRTVRRTRPVFEAARLSKSGTDMALFTTHSPSLTQISLICETQLNPQPGRVHGSGGSRLLMSEAQARLGSGIVGEVELIATCHSPSRLHPSDHIRRHPKS